MNMRTFEKSVKVVRENIWEKKVRKEPGKLFSGVGTFEVKRHSQCKGPEVGVC